MSILEKVRSEGYWEGWSQASQVNYDEAFYNGQQNAYADQPRVWRWFLAGMVVSGLLAWMILS